ncbi:MAG TPA: BrnA antitoxin family protein [Bryobacteraceae bacterium]|nr:BrnA antitoxin family protein [Bryobacteraceae bacterium]
MSKKSIKSDLARVDRMKDGEIDYSDIPPLDKSFFTKAAEAWPPAKQQLTIRLDADVLTWLRANGRGYQTRINRILRAAMESTPPRRLRSAPAPKKKTRSRGILKPA